MSEKSRKYLESSIKKYLDDLSFKLPAPGGGSAAALTSSVGVALLSMVANFTVGKKGYEWFQDEIKDILKKLSTAGEQLQILIDEDVAAYSKLSDAYKTPKEDALKNGKIQQALKNALSIPARIFEISVEAIPLAERLSEIGNKNLISDVACGLSILHAGIESAKFNIDINLKFMDDVDFVKEMKTKYEKIMKDAFEEIEKIIKKTEVKL
ncbi:MAG: formimidoyltetrahydrofolate cyclodeaminase [Elusimicrobia bacterium CG06_land_8_20_14_3_00_38_11]|nr:MAG: formimidoyltetrahydrofolate cyclodeaminase [Elusimicrobia bacterium CG06_land_8_20_14_3_00_38_11]